MTDTKLASTGNIRIWFGGLNSIANPKSPTAGEINGLLDISDSVSWNDFDFGIQASNTVNDPAITAKSAVSDRGASQYGGALSFYYPRDEADATNGYKLTYDALRLPGTQGYIVMRVDGKELTTTAGTISNPGTEAAAGDLVHVFRVESAGWTDSITGEEAFRYTISFLSKGLLSPYAVVTDGSNPAVVNTPLTLGGAIGEHGLMTVTVAGREYTRGVRLVSSDPDVATVSRNGVVSYVGSGTANITATHEATGATSTAPTVVTVP